jgi:ribonuclease P protein component
MGKFTFPKSERLSKEMDIQELFTKGSSFYFHPFKVLLNVPSEKALTAHQVLISVSKRNFRKAVSRNRIKRIIREAYRVNKSLLPSALYLQIGFVYTHKEILSAKEVSSKMVHVLKRVLKVSAQSDKSP